MNPQSLPWHPNSWLVSTLLIWCWVQTLCSAISTFRCSSDGSTAFAVRSADSPGAFEIAGFFPNATWQGLFRLQVGAGLVNACGINPQDSTLYCIVTYGSNVFVMRVDELQSEFVAQLPDGTSVLTAAFTLDGTLYYAGDTSISSLEGVGSFAGSAGSLPSTQIWGSLPSVAHGIVPSQVGGMVVYTADLDGSGVSTYVISLVPSGLLLWREGSGFQSFAVQGAVAGIYGLAWQFGSRVFFASSSQMDIVEVFPGSLDFTAMTVQAQRVLALDLPELIGGVNCQSSRPSFPYTCSDLPGPNLLPEMAIQDCGEDNLNGSACPFNCSNAFSHTGKLLCLNGLWVIDESDPPQCVAPCENVPGLANPRTRSVFVGYKFGYWASPTMPTTTTTSTLVCDLPQAQLCLQAVISITDIEVFCVALPTSINCLRNVNCCGAAAQPISGSISSCLAAGLQVDNVCEEKAVADETCDVDHATASCLDGLPLTITSNQSCIDLARAPPCLFSKSCCSLVTGIQERISTCASLGIHIGNPCEEEEFPVASEGAIFRESCRSPRVPANSSVSDEEYVCKNSSFAMAGASNLTCVDLPCRLSRHAEGSYDCVLDGRQVMLTEDSAGYLVPFGSACSLRCNAEYQEPVPVVEYRCAYAEAAYPDIIYLSDKVSSSAVPQMVERSLSGTLVPLTTSQICSDISCTLPTLDDTAKNILSIECEGSLYNSTCSPRCASGYEPDGRQELRCRADGRFHGFLSCLPLPCRPALEGLQNPHMPP